MQGQRLSGKIHQLIYLTPANNILQHEEKIAILHHRLTQNIYSILRLDIKRFDGALKNLNALSPLSILNPNGPSKVTCISSFFLLFFLLTGVFFLTFFHINQNRF